jgi:hypothetical protein
MEATQSISIALPAYQWLLISGWMLNAPASPPAVGALLNAVNETILENHGYSY